MLRIYVGINLLWFCTAGLTTHVLDMTKGRPGAGMNLKFFNLTSPNGDWSLVKELKLNSDGRTDGEIMSSAELEQMANGNTAIYKLQFDSKSYYGPEKQVFFPYPEVVF